MTFSSILKKYRENAYSEREKGSRFERLIQGYLQTDPKYSNQFRHVWLWDEFPFKEDLGSKDIGIDLVSQTHDGDYWAIQCKFFDEYSPISKSSVDTFLSTSSRTFTDDEGNRIGFSVRLWVSTSNLWGPNAEESFRNQSPPVVRLNLYDLEEAPVDWEKIENGIHGEEARNTDRKVRPHQQVAVNNTHDHFKRSDRGKLIMACGTGKTFTSLRIAENETNGTGVVLFLVPSIALLGQTLREWTSFSQSKLNCICICSDPEVSKKKSRKSNSDGYSVIDLALPASTDVENIIRQFRHHKRKNDGELTVVFSTYQSIDVIAKVQERLSDDIPELGEFDLIICDEAHRTTGVTLSGEDESSFTKVHNNDFLRSKKRLYMTATPRLYSDEVKSKAKESDAILCSMDDKNVYGEEIYRIGFGEAVDNDLLTDYKVLVLTLNEDSISPSIQKMVADKETEINTDDASKLIGCINALSKQILGDNGVLKESDPDPMRRAVAFCQNIPTSKRITEAFNTSSDVYIDDLPDEQKDSMVRVQSRHIDGTMSAPKRDEMLGWLKGGDDPKECRILTNVKVLSEGVDVPSLDSVLFLSARNSQVDVVQSVGRVMRKAPNKKYGYIIIPVVIPSSIEPEKALNDNERFKVVWTVLNALRAHDDRFNATINKIELNKKRPPNIIVGGTPSIGGEGNDPDGDDNKSERISKQIQDQLKLQFEELQNVVFARMVQKVGDKRYWEQWAKNVAEIAERQMERITRLIKDEGKHQMAFEKFLEGLRKNINPSISEHEAVEMLSQHIITKPVFDALFEGYSFVNHNPISVSMQKMLDLLEEQSLDKDTETLEKFYESVKMRAQGIDNSEGKQKIIIELYDKFFKTAFPKMVEKLGIVYTPTECVDFIIHSVNDVLKKEFGRGLTDENIHILDPFTGTGTFITRLLQSGLIEEKDLERKYKHELHANEIVLLAYYIAAINIENAYHDATPDPDDGIGKSKYTPYDGIVLTDTFQLGETDDSEKLFSEMFPQNSKRVERQKKSPLRVIIGNPPYSIGQKSANDNAQNQKYDKLDSRIAETYATLSSAGLNKSLYDVYIKAFRWSADRLDPKNGGVIAFVSNGAWLDGNSTDGFRKAIEKEFSSIWVFNTRGNARTQGELRRKEAGNVFGGGSRTPISITLLVKNPNSKVEKATIHYHDIGDYLSREEKLAIVKKFKSVGNKQMIWKTLHPNEHGDWLKQRNEIFNNFIPMAPEKKYNVKCDSFFVAYSNGLASGRDFFVYNSSIDMVVNKVTEMVEFYNNQSSKFQLERKINPKAKIKNFVEYDSTKISWTDVFLRDAEKGLSYSIDESRIGQSLYRPFFKQMLCYDKTVIHRTYQLPKIFPELNTDNLLIIISGKGASKEFSSLMTDVVPNYHTLDTDQCFPLYYYEEREKNNPSLFDESEKNDYIRRDGISDFIFEKATDIYGRDVIKEDLFYYVYGLLHSPEYRETFSNDLKKMLPRIPLVDDVKDFWSISNSGRELAELHLNYEEVPRYDSVKVIGEDSGFYRIEKMKFPKKDQKDTIIYNSHITIENIPSEAYEYVVNGKSAIEWIMERYQVKTDKDSGITNDPNDWSDEVGNPRYILDLLLSVINVSVQTVEIVNSLPKLKFD